MRALLLRDRPLFVYNYPAPSPALGEAIVRVSRAGICNTDTELIKGYMGFSGVLGHEFVGVIEHIEKHPEFAAGDRVVAEINCVHANSVARDYRERAQDPQRTTLGIACRDGVFADYTQVPIVNLHKVPDSVSDNEAVFTEPLAAACQILEQVHITPTHRVGVLGDGKLGLLCAQILATTGCELIAIGKHAHKLQILRNRGINTQLVTEWDQQRNFDIMVECTGSATGFDQARQMLHPRGILVLKSTFEGLTSANLTAIVVDEINVVGSRCGPFAPALRLLQSKRVDVLPLISAVYRLDDALTALQHAQIKGTLKVILDTST